MPSMGTQASPGPKRRMGGCSSRSMGRQPAVVPRDVTEWYNNCALGATEWHDSRTLDATEWHGRGVRSPAVLEREGTVAVREA